MHLQKMASSLMLIVSFLFATLSSRIVEASNSSYGHTLLPKGTLNPIDACWRRNPNWATQRQALAKCAVGYGKAALGGSQGAIYVITSPVDDPVFPKPGTLRYAAMQVKPLWITFARNMVIVLKKELYVSSHKTIDGRGVKVEIANGPCIRMFRVSHVIIHGISVHDCKPGAKEGKLDGDAIRVSHSTHIWIDHCHLARCQDGLVDVILSSTAITISNNHFTQHDKAVLLGNDDYYVADKKLRVTVAFNRFGPGLGMRMPRVRKGYAHVANNMYEPWKTYAIGGSADPIILSEGNYFVAGSHKQVTKRMGNDLNSKKWKWGTSKDVFKSGAVFGPTGGVVAPGYKAGEGFTVSAGSIVPSLTSSAGPLTCTPCKIC